MSEEVENCIFYMSLYQISTSGRNLVGHFRNNSLAKTRKEVTNTLCKCQSHDALMRKPS